MRRGEGEAEQMNIEYRGMPPREGTLGMRRKRTSEERISINDECGAMKDNGEETVRGERKRER